MKRKIAKGTSTPEGQDVVVRKCVDCGTSVVGVHKTYHYTECGLSDIKLDDILVFECRCGSVMPEIPAIESLHHALALAILQKKSLLSSEEVRFLRKMARLTQAQLAEIMGVHKTRPSKWESGEEPIGKENDRVLRSCGLFGMLQQAVNSDDPVEATRAATSMIRSLDVAKIFKELKNELVAGPSRVFERGSGDNCDWLPAKKMESLQAS